MGGAKIYNMYQNIPRCNHRFSTALAWDKSTHGLDASTAIDFAKSLRILTNTYKTTTFLPLYKLSENIYKQFDKTLVIDNGRQVFFGPTSEARSYYEALGFREKPRRTTLGCLTRCTNTFEREFKYGGSVDDVPSVPQTLVEAFDKSVLSETLDQGIKSCSAQIQKEKKIYDDFEIANKKAKRKFTSDPSVYSISFHLQTWALMQRQFLLKWQGRFDHILDYLCWYCRRGRGRNMAC
ncbi:hypothetical protein PITC_025590 [Penicillium italicum]|uniref:CDR ABC transporter n=1 Tax=Penicillium italicum TaxID=40296 RepID=A0A0A2LFR6_PENIT|nr:hypothetical protein PITC_025590 [Penicillium italicum]